MAGRGFGKTRTGAEWVRQRARTSKHVNIIGATADDARDIMIEGESGILAVCPRKERPEYVPSKRRLEWPNGGRSLIFTADEPDRLRGKQHAYIWADELGAWRYPESWEQAMFGLRLGRNPQACVTTTPKPSKLILTLVRDPTTHVTRGTTYDNKANLPLKFFEKIIKKYEGTRLGRQELNAELLEDNPGALWQRSLFDLYRVLEQPEMQRIVIALDPSASSNPDSDECGIIAAGLGVDDHYYVIDDLSKISSPNEWAKAAVYAYHQHAADRVIGEANNGGDMIEALIRGEDENVSYKKVHASRGKYTRAEPISALYEQGRVHHVGSFPTLEDQCCDYVPGLAKFSPDRMDALVWALSELSANNDLGLLDFYKNQAHDAEKSPDRPAVITKTCFGMET